MIEKILHFLPVHALQCLQYIRVQIVLRELLDGVEHVVQVWAVRLRLNSAARDNQQGYDGNDFHTNFCSRAWKILASNRTIHDFSGRQGCPPLQLILIALRHGKLLVHRAFDLSPRLTIGRFGSRSNAARISCCR